MATVEPIRQREIIDKMADKLMHKSYRDYFLFKFGINSGLRVGDMIKLKVSDVREKTHVTLIEEKTNKPKRFKLNAEIQSLIADYTKHMSNDDWLFPSRKGDSHISRVQAYRILNDVAEEVGLEKIGTHTLRKTFGYHFYQKTKDVAMLQQLFNHSAPSVTLRYIGINQDLMDEALDDFYL